VESYDFPAKTLYRQRVWAQIERRLRKPRRAARVVYLDTGDALESKFLIDRGYSPDRLLAVNRSPQEAAWITMRLKRDGYPSVKTAGVDWLRAVSERIGGRPDVCNFDGMGRLHTSLMGVCASTVRDASPSVLAVNMLAGREGRVITKLFEAWDKGEKMFGCRYHPTKTSYGVEVNPNHGKRVQLLLHELFGPNLDGECCVHLQSVDWDVYTSSSGQPMVWFVADIAKHSEGQPRLKRKNVCDCWQSGPACAPHWRRRYDITRGEINCIVDADIALQEICRDPRSLRPGATVAAALKEFGLSGPAL
jgi:hypothetical protein